MTDTTKLATPATGPKPKKSVDHPPTKVMVKAAIAALKERTGSSRPAVMKYIAANYQYDNAKAIAAAMKKGVEAGTFVKVKASFKLSDEAKKTEKKPMKPKTKKPAAEKVKKVTKPKIPSKKKDEKKTMTPKKAAKSVEKKTKKAKTKPKKTVERKGVNKTTKKTAAKSKTANPKPKKATKAKTPKKTIKA